MPKHSFFLTRRIDGSKYYISSNKKKNPDFFFVDHFFLLITNQNFMLAPPYIFRSGK